MCRISKGIAYNTYITIELGGSPRLSNPFILINDIVILLTIMSQTRGIFLKPALFKIRVDSRHHVFVFLLD